MSGSTTPLFDEWQTLLGPEHTQLRDYGPAQLTEDDALLVIDMQADFVPADPTTNPQGGKFGVAEGGTIVQPIVDLIDAAVEAGATVCATRDYHPCDHASFVSQGGPFPVHCVQGSAGAKFLPPISAALASGVRQLGSEKVFVAFKAMHEHTDSFGALPYADGGAGRIRRTDSLEPGHLAVARAAGLACGASPMGCLKAPWTGSLVLKQSSLTCLPCDGDELDGQQVATETPPTLPLASNLSPGSCSDLHRLHLSPASLV